MFLFKNKLCLLAAVGKNRDSSIFGMLRVLQSGNYLSLVAESSPSRQPLWRMFSSGRMNQLKQGNWQWRRKDSIGGGDTASGHNTEFPPKSNRRRPDRRDEQNKSAWSTSIKSPVDRSSSSTKECKIKPFDICLKYKRRLKDNTPLNIEGIEILNESGPTMEDPTQQILRSGMVLLKNFLTNQEQLEIVKTCRELGLGLGGFYQPVYSNGARLRLQMMCLGLNWDPLTRKYEDQRPFDGFKPPDIPDIFGRLVERAIEVAHDIIKRDITVDDPEKILPSMSPNICIVNFYTATGRLGLHQDRDESTDSLQRGLPVVSLSVGDSAEFVYGDERDVEKAENLVLESGGVLIFGGDSRMLFHGVSSIIPNSAPEALLQESRLRPGRLNLTFRQL